MNVMRLERTHDMELVDRIMKDPAIWPHIHEDGVGEDYRPVDHESLYWMLVKNGKEVLGLFFLHPRGQSCIEMHTCLLPVSWGKIAAEAAKILLAWVFTDAGYLKLVTSVPSYNRLALRYALASGMTKEGNNRSSYMHNGQLFDQIMLGYTKEEWLCQQQQ